MLLTILTPTYNRAHLLPNLFKSLCNQTNVDFEWLIVDDGSTDDTKQVVSSFKTDKFPIYYHFKSNGGKHTAMNYSHPYIKGELLFIVDSDDTLIPECIEIIEKDWNKYKCDKTIGVLSYTIDFVDGKKRYKDNLPTYYIDDDISCRVNNDMPGDRCEILRTDVFKMFKMPEFPGERFMGEGWLWRNVALKYKTVYIKKAIYIAEYQENGLSLNGRLFRMRNPYGMMENCKSFFMPQVKFKIQLKQMLAFGTYGFCAGLSCIDIIRRSGKGLGEALILPCSYFLYKRWSKVYGFKRIK